jgi:hypothetical protein
MTYNGNKAIQTAHTLHVFQFVVNLTGTTQWYKSPAAYNQPNHTMSIIKITPSDFLALTHTSSRNTISHFIKISTSNVHTINLELEPIHLGQYQNSQRTAELGGAGHHKEGAGSSNLQVKS